MSMRFASFAIVIMLVSVFSASAQSEESENATRSSLTAISLPTGAQRVFPNYVPPEVDQTLETLVEQSGGKLHRSGTEVLLWTGGDLRMIGTKTLTKRLADTLKLAGWRFEIGGTENGVTFFSVLKDAPEIRAVIGFYGESDGTLLFAWSELQKTTEGERANAPLTKGTLTGPVSGNLPDYEFITPSGWSRSDSAGKIVLSKDGDKVIAFLPLMESSGDLERDADRILWQVLKGHNTWYGNGFQPDYGTFERGKTAQGLEYFQAYRYAKKAGDPNEGFVQSRFDAIILLVKLGGGKVAVVVGSQPFQSTYARDSALSAIDLILYDLRFKSVPGTYDLKSEILGSWSAASTTVALAYTFRPNGSFTKGAAHEFRTSRDRYTDNVTTTSYGMTETYSVDGNTLTQNYKRTGQIVKHKARVYQTKYDKDPWQQKLGFLPLAAADGGTIVLSKGQ